MKTSLTFFNLIGPEYWTGLCATGERQSPIDLPSEYSEGEETELPSIQFSDTYMSQNADGALSNNGHTGKTELRCNISIKHTKQKNQFPTKIHF